MSLFDKIRGAMSKQSNSVYFLEGQAGEILTSLRSVNDPELNVNIVDLGLIRSVEETENGFLVSMTLTTRGCPVGPVLLDEAATAAKRSGHATQVELVWEPQWSVDDISPEGKTIIDGGGEINS
jgi:metal-sulfur cluster biosynthetic enzyme